MEVLFTVVNGFGGNAGVSIPFGSTSGCDGTMPGSDEGRRTLRMDGGVPSASECLSHCQMHRRDLRERSGMKPLPDHKKPSE